MKIVQKKLSETNSNSDFFLSVSFLNKYSKGTNKKDDPRVVQFHLLYGAINLSSYLVTV